MAARESWLRGEDIVVFTYADWFASWSTPQQTMSRLAADNRILYVDQPRSFLYGFKRRDPQGAGVWSGAALREVQENLWVYHAPFAFLPVGALPLALAKLALCLNGVILAWLVRRQLKMLRFASPILWNFSPLHGGAVGHMPRKITIYDICDDWVNYEPRQSGRDVITWIEAALIRSADLVFVGTENMREERDGLNVEMHVVHHGADYEHFATATQCATQIPGDIAALQRPVIGAVGVIDPARFDLELIIALARRNPAWSLVLVGPARAGMDLHRISAWSNIYWLGNREIAALPGYLKGMDVTLIPYKVNEATRNIYPLKLQEYLAAGKPVVSAALPAVAAYDTVVYVAADHPGVEERAAEFERQIARALAENSGERLAARQEVARGNSWDERVREKSLLIERVMNRRA